MITDRDICMATWLRSSPPAEFAVACAMSHQLYYCLPTDPLTTAEALMRSEQIRRLPVLGDGGQLARA
jgi:CBS domain-containing protein